MSTPSGQGYPGGEHPDEPDSVSLNKPSTDQQPQAEDPFDPYRFGAPEHPVPPEYAPPGYVPPAPPPQQPPPGPPPGPPQRFGGYPQPPGPSSPYPPPPPGLGYQQHPRGSNAKAIASLIFGIASIVLCWISIFDVVPIAIAVVFGILGLNEAARRGDGRGRGFAIAGIVCAVVGAILATVLSIYLYSRIEPCLDYPSGSDAQTQCIRDQF